MRGTGYNRWIEEALTNQPPHSTVTGTGDYCATYILEDQKVPVTDHYRPQNPGRSVPGQRARVAVGIWQGWRVSDRFGWPTFGGWRPDFKPAGSSQCRPPAHWSRWMMCVRSVIVGQSAFRLLFMPLPVDPRMGGKWWK